MTKDIPIAVGGTPLNLWEVCRNRPIPCGQGVLRTPHEPTTTNRAHPEWRDFGEEVGRHPPMRGWLGVPLIGSDGEDYGFIQASDRLEGDFTEQDEANLVHLAMLTSLALDALAQLNLPEYRKKVRTL